MFLFKEFRTRLYFQGTQLCCVLGAVSHGPVLGEGRPLGWLDVVLGRGPAFCGGGPWEGLVPLAGLTGGQGAALAPFLCTALALPN